MKSGLEYLDSRERRCFDLATAYAFSPVVRLAKASIEHSFASSGIELDPLISLPRIGRNREEFMLHKFRTLNPATDESINDFCEKLRRLGIDELPQIRNIREGTMALAGPRPLSPHDYEAMRGSLNRHEQHLFDEMESLTPGIVSTVAIEAHRDDTGLTPDIRLMMNYEDMRKASHAHTIELLGKLGTGAIAGKMRLGRIAVIPE